MDILLALMLASPALWLALLTAWDFIEHPPEWTR